MRKPVYRKLRKDPSEDPYGITMREVWYGVLFVIVFLLIWFGGYKAGMSDQKAMGDPTGVERQVP